MEIAATSRSGTRKPWVHPSLRLRGLRRATHSGIAVAAMVAVGLLGAAGPASALPDTPTAYVSCGGGIVVATAPHISASQNTVGSTRPDAFWVSYLYKWNGSQWQLWQVSKYFVSQVQSSTATGSLGTTTGYAGPVWYEYNVSNAPASRTIYFANLPSGYYSVVNYVQDSSLQWVGATATNPKTGTGVCAA